jgi:cytochrome b6-f complex iron-sulfur subunit
MTEDGAPHRGTTRRSFLEKLFAGTLLMGGFGILSAVVAYLLPPSEVRAGLGPQRVKVGPAAEFHPDQGKLALVDAEPVWVVQTRGGFAALSAICTHKGCVIKWESARKLFSCPCHDGLFDERGNVVAGLPRRPLTRYRVGLVHGDVYVARGEDRPV